MAMKYFSLLTGRRLSIQPHNVYREPPPNRHKEFLLSDAKNVTLAEYSPVSRDAITAHRLSDYRRHTFSLILLPDIHVVMDDFMTKCEVLTDESLSR